MESSKLSILRIYGSSTDRIESKLMYEFVVSMAKEEGISGATVFRGMMGFGSSNRISSSKFWELTQKLPVVIEIIDSADQLDKFLKLILPHLESMPKGCIITNEPINVIFHKSGSFS